MLKNYFLNRNIIFCVKIHVLCNTSGFARKEAQNLYRLMRKSLQNLRKK